MDWVNARYREISFVPSDYEKELIAIAEVDGTRAGIGRLTHIDDSTQELGGMYVLPEFRKRQVATQIIEFLLERRNPKARVYCLPFDHLAAFYAKYGFRPCDPSAAVPEDLLDKHRWCNETFRHPTLLYLLDEK